MINPDKLLDKLEKIEARLNAIDVTLVKQHASLEEHIRRTNLLEAKMEHVDSHVKYMEGGLKLLGILALIAGLVKIFL
jgi:hypothetical protein